jgi:hypothetical protein
MRRIVKPRAVHPLSTFVRRAVVQNRRVDGSWRSLCVCRAMQSINCFVSTGLGKILSLRWPGNHHRQPQPQPWGRDHGCLWWYRRPG